MHSRNLFPLILTLIIGLSACDLPVLITGTAFEKDLIPEGIAVSEGKVYLSSVLKSKIAVSNLDGKEVSDLIRQGEHGFAMGLGMETHEDKLYAISSDSRSDPHSSKLFVFDKNSGALKYISALKDSSGHFLNDLAISSRGEIFLTDSDNQTLFFKQDDKSELLPFLESESIQYTNGIAISENDNLLYLATFQNGIQVIDRESRKLLGTATQDSTISTYCIDGLKYYKNSLIGIQNGWEDKTKHRVMRYFLNENGTQITHAEVLMEANEYFDIPTTLDIEGDVLYFIANSQLDNFDEANGKVKDPTALKPYYLITQKLK